MYVVDKIRFWLTGFRKFIVINTVLIVGVTFRLTEHINGDELVRLLSACVVAYMASNSIEHITDILSHKAKQKLK